MTLFKTLFYLCLDNGLCLKRYFVCVWTKDFVHKRKCVCVWTKSLFLNAILFVSGQMILFKTLFGLCKDQETFF